MVLFQQLASLQLTSFGDVAEFLFKKVLKKKIVYFVTDQYNQGSIKSLERERRAASEGTMRVRIEEREQKRPKQWKKYLRNDDNKLELVKFLLNDWSHPTRYAHLFTSDTYLFFNCASQMHKLTLNDGLVESALEFDCDQEEADTKVFLCCKHAETYGASAVCISTVDSDIPLYAMYFASQIEIPIYIEIGTNERRRCIDINNIVGKLGVDVCMALPALHSFTGNDYTSAFYGIGKVKAFNILLRSDEFIEVFKSIGDRFTINAEYFPKIEKFVCELYGVSKCANTNEARYKKFCSKKKSPEPQQLPPTRDALLCHMKRVNYVTAVIKSSLTPSPFIPMPCEDYGWIVKDGKLQIQWMLRKPVPDDLIELVSCNCRKSKCSNNQCVCKSHGLPCTDLCNCDICENQSEDNNEDEYEDELEDENLESINSEFEFSDNDYDNCNDDEISGA